jgi:G:T-mismatch repair DNA endonuclease (very short patch repair protein)
MPLSRSENMARIRGTGTRPETALAAALARAGIAVITNVKVDGVRADLVLAFQAGWTTPGPWPGRFPTPAC